MKVTVAPTVAVNVTIIVPTMPTGVVVEPAATTSAATTIDTPTMVPTTLRRSYPHARTADCSSGAGARYGVGRTTSPREEVDYPRSL